VLSPSTDTKRAHAESTVPALGRESLSLLPEARLLPADEEWTPKTWAHFRYQLLLHIKSHGACTVEEIQAVGLEVLHLPLSREELIAVVESARRRGLVSPTGHSKAADGSPVDLEWRLTSMGRQAARSPLAWAMSSIGASLRRLLPPLAAVVTALGLSAYATKMFTKLPWWTVALIALGFVYFAYFVMLGLAMRWSRRNGAGPGLAIANEWTRFQREHRDWYEAIRTPFPWRFTILCGVGAGGAVILALAVHGWGRSIALGVISLALLGIYALLISWLNKRTSWFRQEADEAQASG
jgi:hypothetical protein